MANNMFSSAGNLFTLLENLLEWSRIKQGQASFKPVKCNLYEVINQNTELHKMQIEKKWITITNSISPDTFIYADLQMLNGIIRNLLSNAIKFSHPRGSVLFRSTIFDENTLEISICDSGIGIPDEMKRRLFVLGADSARKGTAGEPSTGLGLLLCKEYIEKHSGNIRLESEEEHGSTFHFTSDTLC
jgi:signal transduction histidine kinase